MSTFVAHFPIGYRGTGKSATARVLAERLSWSWCDADQLLEERFAKTIRQIFDEEGEAGFRAKETAILDELSARPRCVIATGGGVVLRPENRNWLKSAPPSADRGVGDHLGTTPGRPIDGRAAARILPRAGSRKSSNCSESGSRSMKRPRGLDHRHEQQPPERVAEQIVAWLQGEAV